MRRRTLLKWVSGFATTIRAWGQTGVFSAAESAVLREVAATTLPLSLGREGTDRIAGLFETYVREYRPGADTEHGYGFTRVVPKGPSPLPQYRKQLGELPAPVTRDAVAAALDAMKVVELPRLPDGKSVIADLMSFYFRSAEANDLCYEAAIQREACRGLAGSSKAPARLRGRA